MMPSDAAGSQCVARVSAEKPERLWTAAIAIMCLCVITMACFPLLQIETLPSNNYNEGWNAYRQWMTVEGQPLYSSQPTLWTTNYPFLSFHIIGLLGAAKGNMVLAGRIVCFVSLIVTSVLVGGLVRLVTGSQAGALYAGLCLFAWFASFYDAGRASNEPELLSAAFTMFGLFAYFRVPTGITASIVRLLPLSEREKKGRDSAVIPMGALRAPRNDFWAILSAIGFALSLFTKHDLIAFPISIGIHLIITRNWRSLVVFLAAGIGAAGLLLAVSFRLDGPYFFAELLHPRAYSLGNLGYETLHYLIHFLAPLSVGVVLLLRDSSTPYRSFLFTLLIVTHLVAVYFSGGDGVAANVFYPPVIADLLICVITICRLERRFAEEPQARKSFRTALVIITVAVAIMVPVRLHYDIVAQLHMPAATGAAEQAIAALESTAGPAICEDLLLCYESGKPMDYDPYYVHDQVLIGRIQESSTLAMLAAHHYAAIQIDGAVDASSLPQRKDERFSKPFLRTLLAQYRPVLVTQTYSVFVPRS